MSNGSDELLELALTARRENRLADARQYLVEAVNRYREAEARVDLAKALTCLGQMERDMHHSDAALRNYGEAAAIYRAAEDALHLAHTVRHVGDIHQQEGHPGLAEPCYQEALAIYRSHVQTPPLDLANAIRGLAILKGEVGEAAEARRLWEEAKDLYAAVNVKVGVEESLGRLTRLEER
jgi:tetratricopeptide (TPR) repeat protein